MSMCKSVWMLTFVSTSFANIKFNTAQFPMPAADNGKGIWKPSPSKPNSVAAEPVSLAQGGNGNGADNGKGIWKPLPPKSAPRGSAPMLQGGKGNGADNGKGIWKP